MRLFKEYSETEEDLEKEHDDFILKQIEKSSLSKEEIKRKLSSEPTIKKGKNEWKIMKNQFDRYTFYTIKDQLNIYKKLEEISLTSDKKNKETLKFLGDLLFNHIKDFCDKERLIDEEIINLITNSSILDDEDKQEFDLEKKIAASKKSKEADLTSINYRLLIQKKLYILLLKIKYKVIGFKMRVGMVFYKYIDEENEKHILINKYLLYRIEQYINED